MECTACGRDNRPSAGYCASCGAELEPPGGPFANADSEQEQGPFEASPDSHEGGIVTRKLDLSEMLATDGPLEPGTLLDERYEIVELQETTPDCRTYDAVDRRRCPSCGRVAEPDETAIYCVECGAKRDTAPPVLVVEYVVRRPESFASHWQQGGRDYYVIDLPPPDQAAEPAETLRLTFGSAIHPGYHYDHNEDALDARLYADHLGTSLGFFVVADGVGGQQGGEIASKLAIATVWERLYHAVWQDAMLGQQPSADALKDAMADALHAANIAVYEERTARGSEMGTTLTAALTVGRQVYVGNVGDSRAYLFDQEGLRRITQDHSLVQRMVDAGQLASDEVYTHPRRNVIYRSIGDRPQLEVDTFADELSLGGRLLLCSDGLWEMVREDGLEEVLLAEPDPQEAADRLVQNALLAGGADNISVIIVQARG